MPHRREQWLDVDQTRRLLAAAAGDPLEALFVLALTTGMRQSELLGLKWEDVDLANGSLRVRRALQRVPGQGFVETEPKSATSRRQITLTPLGLAALKRHREPPRVAWRLHPLRGWGQEQGDTVSTRAARAGDPLGA